MSSCKKNIKSAKKIKFANIFMQKDWFHDQYKPPSGHELSTINLDCFPTDSHKETNTPQYLHEMKSLSHACTHTHKVCINKQTDYICTL
jgi:hypothetical protein